MKMETTVSLYNQIKENCPDFPEIKFEGRSIDLLDAQVINIKESLINLFVQGHLNYVQSAFKEIAQEPSHKNGKVYEVLVYHWLQSNHIQFELQPTIEKEDCFKKNGNYKADGRICDSVFDVKLFGVGFPLLKKIREEFQLMADAENKMITISGPNDLSNKAFQYVLEHKQDIYNKLKSDKYLNHDMYIMKREDGLEFRLCPIRDCISYIGSFNSCEWAQNNELYFVKHGSQFCRNQPYMIFCPFDKSILHMLSNDKDRDVFITLRFLCRRMFINVSRFSDKMLHDYDGKAELGISLSSAMRKVSAIIFIDVSQSWSYETCRMWVFVNPNADNPIKGYQIASWFRYAGAYIEDFMYDNY